MLAPDSAENVTTFPDANEPRDWDVLLGVLDETMQTLRDAGIPFLLIGGIGSAVFGRDRGTRDIDLFVRPEIAKRVLELLGERGYTTKVEYEHWLYKAFKHDVLVDVIFRSSRDILLDEVLVRRDRDHRRRGARLGLRGGASAPTRRSPDPQPVAIRRLRRPRGAPGSDRDAV
jgi:hypothetical protein